MTATSSAVAGTTAEKVSSFTLYPVVYVGGINGILVDGKQPRESHIWLRSIDETIGEY